MEKVGGVMAGEGLSSVLVTMIRESQNGGWKDYSVITVSSEELFN
jgi:hypothetical protein